MNQKTQEQRGVHVLGDLDKKTLVVKASAVLGGIAALVAIGWCIFGAEGKMYTILACGVYVIISVAEDVSISLQKTKGSQPSFDLQSSSFHLNPLCAVVLDELLKLLVSLAFRCASCVMDGSPLVSEQVSRSDIKWLSFPAVCYTVNNILVWYAIGNNDLATFGIFRETMVFWTAALWFIVFRVPPGPIRLAGLALILLGLIGNQIAKEVMGLAASLAGLWVLFMGLTNAISSVVNEVALKQNQALDLNVQNSIMYSQMVLISLLVLVVTDPVRLHSVPAFFHGFTQGTACTICLQAAAGLLISRLLKYGDATMKTVAVCLRGPTVVLLTTAPASSFISAFVVSSGCLIYLSQGPLKPVESLPVKKETGPTRTEALR